MSLEKRGGVERNPRYQETPDYSVEAELQQFGISGADLRYASSLLDKYRKRDTTVIRIGENFIPSALLSQEDRPIYLGAVDFAEKLEGNQEYLRAAKDTNVTLHPLDAGIGSSVARREYLQQLWALTGRKGELRLGAKGTDLYFDVKLPVVTDQKTQRERVLVSIMELKWLRAIREADKYRKTVIRPVVNEESVEAVNDFLESTYLPDRLDQRLNIPKRSHKEATTKHFGIEIGSFITQADLPNIDVATRQLSAERKSPGNHGQVGFMVLEEIMNSDFHGETPRVRALYNGDGTNNAVSAEMVGFTVKENAGIVMVTTTKMGIDLKGGLIGIEKVQSADGNETKVVQICELAQAKKAGQEDIFYKMGLADDEKGKQYFNTNIALFNEKPLGQFLQTFRARIGEEEFLKIITPDLIENEKIQNGKKFVQLEGALASVLLNLNRYVTNSSVARELWQEISGGSQFLRIVNIDSQRRDRFFTPIKYASDFWLQAGTNHFEVDTKNWHLVNTRPGHLPTLSDAFVQNPYYMDVANMFDALGTNTDVSHLDYLDIRGKIIARDAVWKGTVSIQSEYDGDKPFNLDAPELRKALQIGDSNPLAFDNVSIEVGKKGDFSISHLDTT